MIGEAFFITIPGEWVLIAVVLAVAAALAWRALSRRASLPRADEVPDDPLHELVTCHECGEQHSALEHTCPHCGRPREPEQTP